VKVPVFPLSSVVFFPHTFLPLHVFEPRYRGMVEDALGEERLIAMTLAREERPPGAAPAIHRIGSVGRIEVAEPFGDGRWKIVLRGLARIAVGRLRERPARYFAAELEVLAETLPDLQDPRVAEGKAELLLTARRYGELVLGGDVPGDLLGDALPYPALVNRAADLLRAGVHVKQALLDLDDMGERGQAVARTMADQIGAHVAAERFRERAPSDPRLN